ncbi:MAG: DNA polymerase IV [Burkholderiales bacterium]|nr:MAG: DNA polymerase IV [Burkholderiales bacterium]
MARHIAHLDMDAFYASVELLRYTELRGCPLVIGGGRRHQPQVRPDGSLRFARLGDYAGRGVITTATYEARAFGVGSGMGLMRAAALCPHAVLLPTDFDEYRRYSRLFKAAVATIAPVIEDRGIDEIYVDLTGMVGVDADGGRAIALRIKQAVREATGLTCSIGLTPNKLLSKLASELDKPDGLTILGAADIPARIWPLPASRINGIGPKASARLAALGIRTIGELAAADRLELIARFGPSYGVWLHEAAHGRDQRPVVTASAPKSISRETTFERDLHPLRDRAQLSEIFTRLCERVAQDLERKGYVGRTIGIKLRFEDFSTVTRDRTLPAHTADAREIRRAATECLKRVALTRRLRLLGVRVGSLERRERACATPSGGRAAAPAQVREPGSTDPLPLFDQPRQ